VLAGAALAIGAAPSFSEGPTAAEVPLEADIVVMGEAHDAPAHHANQAAWVARMGAAAVVFEMLPEALGPVAMAGRGSADLGAALDWEARGWGDFDAYSPIFAAAGDALILGAEVGAQDISRAASDGAAAVYRGPDLGLETSLPPAVQAEMAAEQDAAHCGLLPEALLPGMVEVQRLRDAALAAAALEALDRTGGPVAVITGNGHARTDRAVPALIAGARPDLSVTAIGQGTGGPPDAPFDVWVDGPVPDGRDGDPCAALR